MNIQSLRRRVSKLLSRFPSETATFSRQTLDEYGQSTDAFSLIGQLEVWRVPSPRPGQWKIENAGQWYEDASDVFVCAMYEDDLPEIRHGDRCVLQGGETRTVRNIWNDTRVRVFYQLSEA